MKSAIWGLPNESVKRRSRLERWEPIPAPSDIGVQDYASDLHDVKQALIDFSRPSATPLRRPHSNNLHKIMSATLYMAYSGAN
jgi:hypothetical protein